MTDKHYVGETGTNIIIDTGSDIEGATTSKILVRKPDGTHAEWEASVYDETKLKYTLAEGDLDKSGTYYMQAMIGTGSGEWRGETDSIYIYPNYS